MIHSCWGFTRRWAFYHTLQSDVLLHITPFTSRYAKAKSAGRTTDRAVAKLGFHREERDGNGEIADGI